MCSLFFYATTAFFSLLDFFRIRITGVADREADKDIASVDSVPQSPSETMPDTDQIQESPSIQGRKVISDPEQVQNEINKKVEEIINNEVLQGKKDPPILLVNVKNVYNEPVKQTQELKVNVKVFVL